VPIVEKLNEYNLKYEISGGLSISKASTGNGTPQQTFEEIYDLFAIRSF